MCGGNFITQIRYTPVYLLKSDTMSDFISERETHNFTETVVYVSMNFYMHVIGLIPMKYEQLIYGSTFTAWDI